MTEMCMSCAQARENQAAAVTITLLAGTQVLALPWHSQIPWPFGQRPLPCKRKCSAARAGFDFFFFPHIYLAALGLSCSLQDLIP